jgi:MFS family permease
VPSLDRVYVAWTWARAFLHRGWWLVTSVYLVVDAHLSAAQLVLIGVAQSGIALVFEVPAGVLADRFSRKWVLVLSQLLMGTAMLATGLVTGFGALIATQMLWGLAWSLASGADVAWITDELADPGRISLVLLRSGRAQLTGAVAGMLALGGLAWLTERAAVMVAAGFAMLLLAPYVALVFSERHVAGRRPFLTSGVALVRGSPALLAIFAATFLVNGVAGAFGRVYPLRLIDLGLPGDPTAWLTALGISAFLLGALGLSAVRSSLGGVTTWYVLTCLVGAAGVTGLAVAPERISASAAVLIGAGALPLVRTFGTMLVNQHARSDVRATVHSLMAQADYVGGIVCGLVVAGVSRYAGLPVVFVACGALLAAASLLMGRRASDQVLPSATNAAITRPSSSPLSSCTKWPPDNTG